MANKWWRKDSHEKEDQIIAQAAHELIEGIVNADLVNKVKDNVGVDLRDQVSLAEIEDWAKDRDLRGFGSQGN